jgi:hypothetical protein
VVEEMLKSKKGTSTPRCQRGFTEVDKFRNPMIKLSAALPDMVRLKDSMTKGGSGMGFRANAHLCWQGSLDAPKSACNGSSARSNVNVESPKLLVRSSLLVLYDLSPFPILPIQVANIARL